MLSGSPLQAPMPPNTASNGHHRMKAWRMRSGCSRKSRRRPASPIFQNDCGNWASMYRAAGRPFWKLLPRLQVPLIATFTSTASAATSARWRSMPLASLAGRELPSLFGPTAKGVQQALAKLGTSDRFSIVARDFFSRLTSRSLGDFLSRELAKHVGPGKRFAEVNDHSEFNAALDLHCREASRIIKEVSGGWYGRTLQQERQITRDEARKFAHVAFKKLRAELRKRREANA